mgnify:FL=1
MKKVGIYWFVLFLSVVPFIFQSEVQAQQRVASSQMFRLAEGIIRIAEPGQLADSVNVWGDIRNPGRYLIPRGTTVPQMLSLARGPISIRDGETILDWSDIRIEITISSYNTRTKEHEKKFFSFNYKDEFPLELREYRLRNEDIISLETKRKPVLVDYIRVISPALSLITTTLLIIDRIQN